MFQLHCSTPWELLAYQDYMPIFQFYSFEFCGNIYVPQQFWGRA